MVQMTWYPIPLEMLTPIFWKELREREGRRRIITKPQLKVQTPDRRRSSSTKIGQFVCRTISISENVGKTSLHLLYWEQTTFPTIKQSPRGGKWPLRIWRIVSIITFDLEMWINLLNSKLEGTKRQRFRLNIKAWRSHEPVMCYT